MESATRAGEMITVSVAWFLRVLPRAGRNATFVTKNATDILANKCVAPLVQRSETCKDSDQQ